MKFSNYMKLFLIFIAVFMAGSPAIASPKAKVSELEYDAGEKYPSESIVHDFIIKNTGDAPLEIKVLGC